MEGGAVSDLSSRNSLQSDSLRTEPSLVSSSLIVGLKRSHHSLLVFEERWRLHSRSLRHVVPLHLQHEVVDADDRKAHTLCLFIAFEGGLLDELDLGTRG